MRTIFDRNFVEQYARVVYWRGVWMTARALIIGTIAAVSILIAILSYRYLFLLFQAA